MVRGEKGRTGSAGISPGAGIHFAAFPGQDAPTPDSGVRPNHDEATMAELRDTVIPYGKHKGRTLDDVASTGGGLLYLDKQRDRDWVRETHPGLAEALNTYLAEPAVARELERALGR